MYRKADREQITIDDFITPFGGKLLADNRWVRLAKAIPWDRIEDRYAEKFGSCGNVAIPLRVALGSLLIKEKCGFSDEDTLEHIGENNYMQYFIGYREFKSGKPFVPSLMVEFRKRLNIEEIQRIIDETGDDSKGMPGTMGDDETGGGEKENNGTLLIDATCAPADIRYPTDLGLLNEGREKVEETIDILWENMLEKAEIKPRTYREEARKDYLLVEKQRKSSHNKIRKAIGKQLSYMRRDIEIIQNVVINGANLSILTPRQYKNLLVVSELYRQQKEMYDTRTHSMGDRIVSVSQPHVRPIVRGKASAVMA